MKNRILAVFGLSAVLVLGVATPTHANDETVTEEPANVTVCHATGAVSNPWVEIEISDDAVEAHLAIHESDFVVDEENSCPPSDGFQVKNLSVCVEVDGAFRKLKTSLVVYTINADDYVVLDEGELASDLNGDGDLLDEFSLSYDAYYAYILTYGNAFSVVAIDLATGLAVDLDFTFDSSYGLVLTDEPCEPGPQGDPGQDGAAGQDGTAGNDGAAGVTGPAGPQGPQGNSADRAEIDRLKAEIGALATAHHQTWLRLQEMTNEAQTSNEAAEGSRANDDEAERPSELAETGASEWLWVAGAVLGGSGIAALILRKALKAESA